jgi:hypothetical protein
MSQMTAKPTRAELRAMAALLGRRGGLKKSQRKTDAARANAKKPRPRRAA